MALLATGVDSSVIALWLGHESPETTQIYLHAGMTIKERALARVSRPMALPAATLLSTPCWRSSTPSDPRRYADQFRNPDPVHQRRSA